MLMRNILALACCLPLLGQVGMAKPEKAPTPVLRPPTPFEAFLGQVRAEQTFTKKALPRPGGGGLRAYRKTEWGFTFAPGETLDLRFESLEGDTLLWQERDAKGEVDIYRRPTRRNRICIKDSLGDWRVLFSLESTWIAQDQVPPGITEGFKHSMSKALFGRDGEPFKALEDMKPMSSKGTFRASPPTWVFPGHQDLFNAIYQENALQPRPWVTGISLASFQALGLLEPSGLQWARITSIGGPYPTDVTVAEMMPLSATPEQMEAVEIDQGKPGVGSPTMRAVLPQTLGKNVHTFVEKNHLQGRNSVSIPEDWPSLPIPKPQLQILDYPQRVRLAPWNFIGAGEDTQGRRFIALEVEDPLCSLKRSARVHVVKYEHEAMPRVTLSFRDVIGQMQGNSLQWQRVNPTLIQAFLQSGHESYAEVPGPLNSAFWLLHLAEANSLPVLVPLNDSSFQVVREEWDDPSVKGEVRKFTRTCPSAVNGRRVP